MNRKGLPTVKLRRLEVCTMQIDFMEETKTCTKCGKEKPLIEFNFKNKKKNERQSMCKECQRKRQRELYNKIYKYTSVERYKKNRKQHRILMSQLLEELKSSGCLICGEKDPCCLDFHHLYNKSFNLASAREVSVKRLKEEAEKCVILCANCHRKLHAGKIKLP